MASLSEDDIEKLFSGAPQYFARSEGHFTGAPHPSVAYPWDESLEIRDLTDHVQIEDPAWSNVTAWPHITRRCGSQSMTASVTENVTANVTSNASGTGAVHTAAGLGEPATSSTSASTSASTFASTNPKQRSHFYPRSRERPSMLSIQGLEKGTIGYEAALELAVSDALQEEQYGFDSLGWRPNAVKEARKKIMEPIASAAATQAAAKAEHDGSASAAECVGETQILEELIRNSQHYADGSFYLARQSEEFYSELFHHILRPPSRRPRSSSGQHHRRSGSHTGAPDLDANLIHQIEALLDVLATPNIWIDFSHVEWRLRLGQILWASSPQGELDPGLGGGGGGTPDDENKTASPPRPATVDERYTERYWLLLQILLSTELLMRLDAITAGDEYGLEFVHPTEVHRFEKIANTSVRWSLMLARAWLENIEVVRIDEEANSEGTKLAAAKLPKDASPSGRSSSRSSSRSGHQSSSRRGNGTRHTVGWITTLSKKLSLIEGRWHASKMPEKKHVYAMRARHASRQYRGVAHFAQELKWPDDLIELLSQKAMDDAHCIREPLNNEITETPPCSDGASSPHAPSTNGKLEFSRNLPRRRRVVAELHPGGWLSRSYLSGLMLPGDSLCHLLMSTLIEGDEAALQTLGPVAHLGAGFVYRGKSFWSTACIVGRVLAAGAGAAECMGWVSSDVLPGNVGEEWVNIDADDVADDLRMVNRRARIWGKAAIERESSVLGDADPESVLPADFVIPCEGVYKSPPQTVRIELQSLQLYSPQDANQPERATGDGSIEPAERDSVDGADDLGGANNGRRAEPRVAETTFVVTRDGAALQTVKYDLSYDIYFVTAHPCVPSTRVKVVRSASSPTIQQVDVAGGNGSGNAAARSSTVHVTGHPLHKYYGYASIHLTALIENPTKSLQDLLKEYAVTPNNPSTHAAAAAATASTENRVLVIDCVTGFKPQPAAHEIPLSPMAKRTRTFSFDSGGLSSFPPLTKEISPIVELSPAVGTVLPASPRQPATAKNSNNEDSKKGCSGTVAPGPSKMHHETRRRRFGSDMEILVRALCAERGWNALISRRRRGCLSCAIREAGALGWHVVIRVD
ncbi:hypothetical protein SEPCBS119000_004004 [Sporothrix epigloea]|uniref:Uncharacterized protein n=1 Tax=Sporothrix epigloea TaxID=1892477 RepID=A0ABP0DTF4_9PEZI